MPTPGKMGVFPATLPHYVTTYNGTDKRITIAFNLRHTKFAVSDFENELQMAQMNKQLSGVETLFIPTSSAHSFIASRLLREVARFGGDVTAFVPKTVAQRLEEKFAGE